jgi:hypothetical protein
VANLPEPLVSYRIHPGQVSVQKLRQEVMCWIAARAAAQIRARGGVDPLWETAQITPEVLASLGVTPAAFDQALASSYFDWMNAMWQASNDDAVLQLIEELLELSRSDGVDSVMLSEACLRAARVHYRRGAFLESLSSTARAVCIRPVVAGRPLKKLLRRAVSIFSHRGASQEYPAS